MKILAFIFTLTGFLMVSSCGSSNELPAPEEETEQTGDRFGQEQQRSFRNQTGFSLEEYNAMITQLDLSEEQENTMKEINQKYSQQIQKMIDNSEGDYRTIGGEFSAIRDAQNAEIQATLSAEQFEMYTDYMDELRERRRNQRRQRTGN